MHNVMFWINCKLIIHSVSSVSKRFNYMSYNDCFGSPDILFLVICVCKVAGFIAEKQALLRKRNLIFVHLCTKVCFFC